MLGAGEPVFFVPGLGFTQLEAKFDRGIGMLLRPPSRLFGDAGLETIAARAMPIRLDATGGIMGSLRLPRRCRVFATCWRAAGSPRAPPGRGRAGRARRSLESCWRRPPTPRIAGSACTKRPTLSCQESRPRSRPGCGWSRPTASVWNGICVGGLEAAARPPKEPGLLARLLGRGVVPRADDPENSRRWRGNNDVTPPPAPEPMPEGPDSRARAGNE